jgi:hypothetical protein
MKYLDASINRIDLANRERRLRLERYEGLAKHVIELLKPRLAAFIERFKPSVTAEPIVRGHTRAMNLTFAATMAKGTLLFEVFPFRDVTRVRLECTQEIIPVVVRYGKRSVVEFPLDGVRDDAIVQWFDDRIVAFVKAYIGLVRQDEALREQLKGQLAGGSRVLVTPTRHVECQVPGALPATSSRLPL